MNIITVEDIAGIFPRPLDEEERERAEKLLDRSMELIELEFLRHGRDLESEAVSRREVILAVRQAVIMMVSRAIHIGDAEGKSSLTSATGPQSDAITFSQGVGIKWGSVGMDNEIRAVLGLAAAALPRGGGGVVVPYGRVASARGVAEFAERPRRRWWS